MSLPTKFVIDMIKKLLLALMLTSPFSFGDFTCEVKDQKWLNDDGSLTSPPNQWHVGAIFVVDKLSGDVTGDDAPMLDMTVLYVGDDENAWKGISTPILDRVLDSVKGPFGVISSIGNSLDLMWISTYKEGPNKPFIYHDATSVLTGICKVF
jgi:hypothetical protein